MVSQIRVFSDNGKKEDKLELGIELVQKDTSPKTYSCAIRRLLQGWRQGTVGCKSRGEVAFSNRKPWKQKGTGRARAGSARSPIWRKGGVVFGPSPRVRSLKLNSKQNRLVMNNLFFDAIKNKSVICLDFLLSSDKPKLKVAANAIGDMGIGSRKVVLFLPFDDAKNFASFRGISNVNVISFDQPNAFDLAGGVTWLFLKKDLDSFKNMVLRWN